MADKKILFTSFKPFGGYNVNTTSTLTTMLKERGEIESIDFITLDVSYEKSIPGLYRKLTKRIYSHIILFFLFLSNFIGVFELVFSHI